MTAPDPIPVSVVGGFLGSGKTTLLNRLLRENDERRLGLIVNDFGDINIDEKLIVARDEDMVSLANGCICCSIGNDFLRALISLVTRPDPPEQIIIEASGVADPLRIGAIARADKALRLQGIFVLVDVTKYLTQCVDPLLADTVSAQVQAADLLVLTKSDISTVTEVEAVSCLLEKEKPGALQVVSSPEELPASLLFDFADGTGGTDGVAAHRHAPHDVFWTGSISNDLVCDIARLKQVLALQVGLLRCKGFVRTAEGAWRVVQWVAGRLDVTPLIADRAPIENSLVYIGVGERPAGLDQALKDAFS
jgi:G3E family GTPase